MSIQAKCHPSAEMLGEFVAGSLPTSLSIVIAAHVEQCAVCRAKIAGLEAQATVDWLQSMATRKACRTASTGTRGSSPARDLRHLVADITRQPQLHSVEPDTNAVAEIHMLDRSVRLPKVLAKVASGGLVWKKRTGGINRASVTLDDHMQCEFLYLKPGSQIPVHRHQGTEVTLVLDGSFSDETGRYERADFVVRNRNHTHQPASEEGCLCFAVLDSPLALTGGLARLMNPVLNYRFRRATRAG